MNPIHIFTLTAIAAASLASTGLARDAGERAPASIASAAPVETAVSGGRNSGTRTGTTATHGAFALLVAEVSQLTGRNDCVRSSCGSEVE